jgi:putative PIN family toxin of toxin-antitoxin system
MRERVVIDTNVYVSRLIREQSIPGQAVGRAWREAVTLTSTDTLEELRAVLNRPKFARYIQSEKIEPYIEKVGKFGLILVNSPIIRACRDPKDDKFLEVTVHGRADVIVTGDTDLLTLHPFRGIAILTPADYLKRK